MDYLDNPEILTEKISEDKIDSFWYHGKDIARIQYPNGTKIYAEASGDIGLYFEEDGDVFKGQNAVDEAIKRNLTDKDLDQLGIEDRWRNNNWFVIIKVDINGEVIGDDLGIGDNYDHAIEILKEVAKQENPYKEV